MKIDMAKEFEALREYAFQLQGNAGDNDDLFCATFLHEGSEQKKYEKNLEYLRIDRAEHQQLEEQIMDTSGKEMTISEIMVKMIEYSRGNLHDIQHFLKVYACAKTIGECEKVSPYHQRVVEIAAIVHDIACPLCREKYGNTNGKYQEREGPALTEEFLQDTGLPKEMIRRVCFLVGHHHTVDQIDGIDYQILLEADYLVNAEESGYSAANIRNTKEKLFRTQTGTALLESICQETRRL